MNKKRILLLNPKRRYLANEYGFGYQMPLGLVFIGGPLVDAGFEVKIVDADAEKLSIEKVIKIINEFNPFAIGVSHTGSTASHPTVVEAIKRIKRNNPQTKIVYGGVYPTFAYRSIIEEVDEIDFIVRGEGEATALDLFSALRDGRDPASVKGIAWRHDNQTVVNTPRPPIDNLDDYRPGFELVNWKVYDLLGRRSSGIQLGRGCPNVCDFCGQWIFWKKYRRRSPKVFVDQVEHLAKTYNVRAIWPADEHFAADREALLEILEDLIARNIRVSLSINTSVDAIIRDKDIMHLYKKAGVDFAAIGIESDSDDVIDSIHTSKSSYTRACEAVQILKDNQIVACANVIYGLENESFKTIARKARRLIKMDPDFLNAMYLTPHFWTPAGARTNPAQVIQPDLARWDYRHQIMNVEGMSARQLFAAVKITEALLHARPKRLWRGLTGEKNARWMSMYGMYKAFGVWVMEIAEFAKTKFAKPGVLADQQPDKIKSLLPYIKRVNVKVDPQPVAVVAEAFRPPSMEI